MGVIETNERELKRGITSVRESFLQTDSVANDPPLVCRCVCECLRACVLACVRACVRACVHAYIA